MMVMKEGDMITSLQLQVFIEHYWASQAVLVVKDTLASAGEVRDVGLIPGLGRSPGEGNGNPLQYSYLKNSMDRRAWWNTVHGITKNWT